jgi:L-serine deaminase
MIDPSDMSLTLRAIRNADAEQLRQIIDALSTATAGPITVPAPAGPGIVRRRARQIANNTAEKKPGK